MLNVTVRQLQVFVAVARSLSFARAAEELHLTAPAVSMQVRELERVLGLPVFDRRGRKVSLTITGEYFLLHARRMLGSLRHAEDQIARLRSAESGPLSIGMLSTAQYFLPRLMADFLQGRPGVELALTVANRETLTESLRRNELDLAIMGRPPKELDTRAEPFATHPLGIVAAPSHPLARLPQVTPELIAGTGFITREPGSGTRAWMETYFKEQRIAPPVIMQMPSNEAIKQAVIANMGLAFLSLHTVALELQAGLLSILHVDGLPVLRQWHVAHTRGRTLSPVAEAFRYYMLENGQAFLHENFSPPH